jgi:hypothetical protein
MRSLHADGRSRRAIWFLLIPAVVLAAWTSWFLGAHVSRYEVSDRARIEVNAPGSIVPSGEPRVIAEFASTAALGHIRAGQHAHLRLPGFGSFPAHVTSVGGQIRDGTVRVELAVDPSPAAIPVQNGLPATVEVEVESVSPATLLLRAAGRTP